MSKAKALEILEQLGKDDARAVGEYNNAVSWNGYSIERHLSLTAFRLNHLAGQVVRAMRELAEDEQPPVSSGSAKE